MIPDTAPAVFVGRQPIYSAELDVVAFELLFRAEQCDHAAFSDGEMATANLVLNSFAEIGLERITGELPAFINVPRNFLVERHAHSLPKDRVVLEILEDVLPEPDVLEAVAELKQEGYKIAMDDFVLRDELLPMVDLVDIVKVEFPALTELELGNHVAVLRERGVQILAEKIETYEDFDRCRDLGFDLYQGYFFAQPKVITGGCISVNNLTLLNLIAQLQDPGVSAGEIAASVQIEPSLSYKLLRFVNSSYCALNTRVHSMHHAVTIAGMQRIKTLCSLLLLTKTIDHKPFQLIVTALTRAKMCELLATRRCRDGTADQSFLVGLFSAMDAVLDKPLDEVVGMIRLSHEVEQALLQREGVMGEILGCVLAFERAHWNQVRCGDLRSDEIQEAYLDAIAWSAEVAAEAFG